MGTASRPMMPNMSAMVRSEAHIDRSAIRSERNSANMRSSTEMMVTMSERTWLSPTEREKPRSSTGSPAMRAVKGAPACSDGLMCTNRLSASVATCARMKVASGPSVGRPAARTKSGVARSTAMRRCSSARRVVRNS